MVSIKQAAAIAFGACLTAAVGSMAQAAEPVRGGRLTAAMSTEPASLDPIFGNAPSVDRKIFNLLYENLITLDAKGEPQLQLAQSWTIAPDQRSVTFVLRDGIKFHDGTTLDAEAVKFSIERTIDKALNSPHASSLAAVSSVDVLDPKTARVNLNTPSGAVIAALASEAGTIVSPTAVKKDGKAFARNPVGTGPFRFVEWLGADRITVKASDSYWRKAADGKPLPYLDEVVIRFIANSAVKIVEVKSGSVQLGDDIQIKDFEDLEKTPGLKLLDLSVGIHQWMAFNVTKPPFDNKDLRLAVTYGVNRDALNKVIAKGYGTVAPTLVAPTEWVFDAGLPAARHDPVKAKEHLARSGFTGQITLSVIQRDPDTQIAQLVQAMLREIGLKLNVEVLERQAWVDKVLAKNFEAGLLRINTPRPDPDLTFGATFGQTAGANWAGLKDEALFKAVAAGAGTLDRDARRPHYVEAQRILLDNAYYAFFFTRPIREVASARLNNLKNELSGAWILSEAWLTK